MRTYLDIITQVKESNGTEGHITLDDVSEVFKIAQVEALKELQKREVYWLRSGSSESESIYGSIRDTISSLIKEIEG